MVKVMLTREVATMLRVSEEHVRDLIRHKKINAYKEGRRGGYRITLEEVERYISVRFNESAASDSSENQELPEAETV